MSWVRDQWVSEEEASSGYISVSWELSGVQSSWPGLARRGESAWESWPDPPPSESQRYSFSCLPAGDRKAQQRQSDSQTVSQSGTCGGEKYNKTKPPSSPGKFHQQIIPLTSRKQLNICSTLSLFILYYFIWFLLIFVSFLSISKKDN